MLVSAVTWTLLALAAYLAVGAAFAVPFVTRWAGRIDPDAAQIDASVAVNDWEFCV